jgi:hypothetical protein
MLQEPMHSALSIRGEGNRDVAQAVGHQTLLDAASRLGAGNTALRLHVHMPMFPQCLVSTTSGDTNGAAEGCNSSFAGRLSPYLVLTAKYQARRVTTLVAGPRLTHRQFVPNKQHPLLRPPRS